MLRTATIKQALKITVILFEVDNDDLWTTNMP